MSRTRSCRADHPYPTMGGQVDQARFVLSGHGLHRYARFLGDAVTDVRAVARIADRGGGERDQLVDALSTGHVSSVADGVDQAPLAFSLDLVLGLGFGQPHPPLVRMYR